MRYLITLLLCSSLAISSSAANAQSFLQELGTTLTTAITSGAKKQAPPSIASENSDAKTPEMLPQNTVADMESLGTVDEEEITPENAQYRGAAATIQSRLSQKNSIFFAPSTLDKLYLILEGTELEEDFIQENEKKAEPARKDRLTIDRRKIRITRLVPNLYLKSILFFEPTNWSFWLNDQRYTPSSNRPNNVVIDSVSKNSVSIIWHEPNYQDITPEWIEVFEPYQPTPLVKELSGNSYQWDYMSRDKRIFIDSKSGRIRATISPNQSFQSYNLKVIEGDAKSYYAHFKPGQEQKADLYPLDYDLSKLEKEED